MSAQKLTTIRVTGAVLSFFTSRLICLNSYRTHPYTVHKPLPSSDNKKKNQHSACRAATIWPPMTQCWCFVLKYHPIWSKAETTIYWKRKIRLHAIVSSSQHRTLMLELKRIILESYGGMAFLEQGLKATEHITTDTNHVAYSTFCIFCAYQKPV